MQHGSAPQPEVRGNPCVSGEQGRQDAPAGLRFGGRENLQQPAASRAIKFVRAVGAAILGAFIPNQLIQRSRRILFETESKGAVLPLESPPQPVCLRYKL